LGVKQVLFCDHEDAGLHNTKEVRREITHAIRKIKPDVIITFDPTMAYSPTYTTKGGFINHPDHRAAGQAVLDAVYPLARDHLSFPELIEEGLEPHTVGTLLLINFDTCNCFINISTTIEKKMAALHVHKSQQPDTDELRELAQVMGARANMDYAEAFVRIDIP
jgi:LmbE family N-acetylglucosaminyl deacetylase